MSNTMTILCTAHCVHNNGAGYYNICRHPKTQNLAQYSGIDRIYKEGCELQERKVKEIK